MAGILDILGQSRNNSLAPAGGYESGGPSYAPTAPVPGASSNPFSSLMASDSPGLFGMLGKLAGNPSSGMMEMQKLGGQQAQGLAGLQSRIDGGMPPQAAVVDFIGSPEGQQFFGSSQDPIGAIKGYLQLSQAPADKFSAIGAGSGVLNESTGEIMPGQDTTELQTAKGFMGLADLSPQETADISRAYLNKASSTTDNKTQKEAAVDWLVAQGRMDKATGEKFKAGIIQVQQPRDAAGNPLGSPIALDLSEMLRTGNPSDAQVTVLGANNGGSVGNAPAGTPQPEPDGTPGKVSGDIIFGAGTVANLGRVLGGLGGQIDPKLAGQTYTNYQTALQTIFADVSNLFNVNKQLAAEMKIYSNMVDKSGYTSNPGDQATALLNLHDVVEKRLAFDSAIMASSDPRYTGDTKNKTSAEIAALQKLQQDLPPREEIYKAMVKFQQGEGSIQQGIQEGASHVQQVIEGVTGVAKEAGKAATGAEKAVEGQTTSEGANGPKAFKSAQDAAAAAKAGTIRPGDRIIVGGRPGTWQE